MPRLVHDFCVLGCLSTLPLNVCSLPVVSMKESLVWHGDTWRIWSFLLLLQFLWNKAFIKVWIDVYLRKAKIWQQLWNSDSSELWLCFHVAFLLWLSSCQKFSCWELCLLVHGIYIGTIGIFLPPWLTSFLSFKSMPHENWLILNFTCLASQVLALEVWATIANYWPDFMFSMNGPYCQQWFLHHPCL